MLLKELLKEYLLECSLRGFTKRTIKSYRNNLERYINYLERAQEITEAEKTNAPVVKSFLRELQQKGCKETYINSQIKTLRVFYKYLAAEYSVTNPMPKIEWCKEIKPVINTFTNQEAAALIKAFNGADYLSIRNKTIIMLLLDTGLRCFELCCLTKDNFNDDYIRFMGKGKKERVLPLSPIIQKQLIKYRQAHKMYFEDKNVDTEHFFLSRTGRVLTVGAVENVIRRAGEASNVSDTIRCSPHTCRHWFAQAQLKNGLDIYTLSRLLGHTNVKITQVYLNSLKDDDVLESALRTSPLMNL